MASKTVKQTAKKAAKNTAAEEPGEEADAAASLKSASLHELILNKRTGKYECIDRMSFWAKQLRKQEANRHLTQTDILELAVSEVLNGTVDLEELDKQMVGAAVKEKKAADALPISKE